jgi:hypothetical protein
VRLGDLERALERVEEVAPRLRRCVRWVGGPPTR